MAIIQTFIVWVNKKANNLEDAYDMFYDDSALTSVDVSKLKLDSSVNTAGMFDFIKSNATIYVDSTTTRDFILANRSTMKLNSEITESNFQIK